MKIVACLASRQRPAAMTGVIMALHRMRSAQHELHFVVGLDDDDDTTPALQAFEGELAELHPTIAPPPMVRGEVENRMIAKAAEFQPDVVTLMSDRTFNITPAWDEWIARAVTFIPNRVMWWSCPEDPGCIIPIAPRAYLEATDWTWSPEIFPFWWDDTWHQEIDVMIHGLPSRKARCTYSGARGTTANGREFAFWLDVFIKTRPRRRELAAGIAKLLNTTVTMRPEVENYFAGYDKTMAERCPGFEERFGDPRPAPDRYLAARARAEKLLAEIA